MLGPSLATQTMTCRPFTEPVNPRQAEVFFAAGVHAVDGIAARVQVAVQRSRVGVAAHQRVLREEAPVAGVVVPGPQEVQARAVVGLPVELVGVRGRAQAMLRVAERIIIDNTLKLPAITPTIISLFLFKEQVEYAICERPIACNVCIFASWKS